MLSWVKRKCIEWLRRQLEDARPVDLNFYIIGHNEESERVTATSAVGLHLVCTTRAGVRLISSYDAVNPVEFSRIFNYMCPVKWEDEDGEVVEL